MSSDFLQRTTSATSNKGILKRVTSDFLQRATSATSNKQILQQATSDFTTSNEQRVNLNEQRATSEKLRLILCASLENRFLIIQTFLNFAFDEHFLQNKRL